MTEWWHVGVAIYAAIVATGALFLEGLPRLSVSATPNMVTYNVPQTKGNTYTLVTVVNRGSLPTTITNLCLLNYPNRWRRFRRKNDRAAVIANPQLPGTGIGQLPCELGPGSQWMGAIHQEKDLEDWISTGQLYVAIYASHSDRPILHRVKPPSVKAKPLEGAEKK